MAETRGLIIELGADTSQMNKALRQIQAPLAKIQSELKFVEKGLRLNPKNAELLRQKMALLENAVSESKNKTMQLRKELANLRANNAPADQIRRLEREIIMAEHETEQLQRQFMQFKASQTALGKLGTTLSGVGSKLTSAGNAMRTFSMYAGMATVAVGALGYKSAKHADDLNTLSKQCGVATSSLQKFSATSELVDVSTETMAKGQSKVIKAMADGSDVFEKYGINIKNADGSLRSSEDVFFEYMDAMGKISNQTERASAMQELFGAKAYQALMPLAGNVGIIEKYGERFEELGLIMDQDTLDKLNEVKDQIDYLKAVGTLAFYKIGGAIAQALGGNLGSLDEVIASVADKIANMNPFIIKVATAFGAIATVASPVLLFFGAMFSAVGKIATGLSQMSGMLQKVFPFLSKMGGLGGQLTKFLGPIGLAITAFTLMWQNSESFRTSMTQLMQVLGGSVMQVLQALSPFLQTAGMAIGKIATTLGNILAPAIEMLLPWITLLLNAFTNLATGVISKMTSMLSVLTGVFTKVGNALVTPITNAKNRVKSIIDSIKKFFPVKIGHLLKGVKLPKFDLKWGSKDFGKLGTIRYPKGLKISWKAKGAILDNPTLIGAGEAGREGIIPLSGRAMQPFASAIAQNMGINYDAMAQAMVNALMAVNAPVIIQVDGKTIATTTAPYMNNAINTIQARQARQRGVV